MSPKGHNHQTRSSPKPSPNSEPRLMKRQRRMRAAYFEESLQDLQTQCTARANVSTPVAPAAPTSTDIDNNTYNTILFGNLSMYSDLSSRKSEVIDIKED
ncbi:unnamed protein product [Rhizopus microsporus]